MEHKQAELLKLQSNAENTDTFNQNSNSKNTQLIEKYPVPDTGFQIVGNAENGYVVTIGQYKLTPWMKDKDECLYIIEEKGYDFLVALIGALIDFTNKEIQNQAPTKHEPNSNNQ